MQCLSEVVAEGGTPVEVALGSVAPKAQEEEAKVTAESPREVAGEAALQRVVGSGRLARQRASKGCKAQMRHSTEPRNHTTPSGSSSWHKSVHRNLGRNDAHSASPDCNRLAVAVRRRAVVVGEVGAAEV